jgi:DNA polymerase III subunit gamma/tau
MSYQVLARKWRPKSFKEIVGQAHVVRALTHALEQQRLHHAYLFTGTRGVGKTTLSRILAKSLNCETGITATPCGVCSACVSIDKGSFIDYVELDAASNRGVDDMTSLLEQAVYAPTQGRFKVYMLDEVHQLTGHAFNAMLKTLEEPPAHVKFILATTDPQKVPVTVLSRCLQFNLKQMSSIEVSGHLTQVLTQEQISFEQAALHLIARASSGSMRDALSLLDQAIAYGGNAVNETEVRNMLGAIDQTYLFDLLNTLSQQDGPGLMQQAKAMEARSLSFDAALGDLAYLLHHIAIAQTAPGAILEELTERDAILQLAQTLQPETVQLYYQIAVLGRRDLGLAPDEFAGFTMSLLRMLAFTPNAQPQQKVGQSSQNTSPTSSVLASPTVKSASQALASSQAHSAQLAVKPVEPSVSIPLSSPTVIASEPVLTTSTTPVVNAEIAQESVIAEQAQQAFNPTLAFDGDWRSLIGSLKLGLARPLAENCEFDRIEGQHVYLKLAQNQQHLLALNYQEKLSAVMSQHFEMPVKLHFAIGSGENTPAAQIIEEKAEVQSKAVAAIQSDSFVQSLLNEFGAQIVPSSIKPL